MLEKVDANVVRQAGEIRAEIAALTAAAESRLGALLGEAVVGSVQGTAADRSAVRKAVEVELHRGHTCSRGSVRDSYFQGLG